MFTLKLSGLPCLRVTKKMLHLDCEIQTKKCILIGGTSLYTTYVEVIPPGGGGWTLFSLSWPLTGLTCFSVRSFAEIVLYKITAFICYQFAQLCSNVCITVRKTAYFNIAKN